MMKYTPLLKLDRHDVFHKMLGVPDVVGGVTYQWSEDVGEFLDYSIYNLHYANNTSKYCLTPGGHQIPILTPCGPSVLSIIL